MLSGRLTFELFVFLTSKEIRYFTKKKTLIQGVNTLKAEGEVSIRIVDMVEQLESLICSVYLDCS